MAIKCEMLRLASVIEFLAEALAKFGAHLPGVEARLLTTDEREHKVELPEIRGDGTRHVGILQLDRQRPPLVIPGTMHLPQRGGGRRLGFEARKARLPVGPELTAHAAADEGPPHRRRRRLELRQLGREFARQEARDGGEKLRHLHHWSLEPAEQAAKLACKIVAPGPAPTRTIKRQSHAQRSRRAADACITSDASAPVIAAIGHLHLLALSCLPERRALMSRRQATAFR